MYDTLVHTYVRVRPVVCIFVLFILGVQSVLPGILCFVLVQQYFGLTFYIHFVTIMLLVAEQDARCRRGGPCFVLWLVQRT